MPIGTEAIAPLSISPGSVSSASSEITVLCSHGRELCAECGADFREENALTYGIDHVEGREPICVDLALTKDGDYICKRHKTADCAHTNFKKLIAASAKSAKKGKH